MSKVKDKEKNKSSRNKQKVVSEKPTRLTDGFSAEVLQTKNEWHGIFKGLKGKKKKVKSMLSKLISLKKR